MNKTSKLSETLKGCTIVEGFNYNDWEREHVTEIHEDIDWKGKVYIFGSLCVRGGIYVDGQNLKTVKGEPTLHNQEILKGMDQLYENDEGECELSETYQPSSYEDIVDDFADAIEKKRKIKIYRGITIIRGDLYISNKTQIHTVRFD